jgi:hypothetical protein
MNMRRTNGARRAAGIIAVAALTGWASAVAAAPASNNSGELVSDSLAVDCANLTYAGGKTSRCVAPGFLKEFSVKTDVVTTGKFATVKLEDATIFEHPFCVMSGEGPFTLTLPERTQLREYLTRGGFLLASAGCSSEPWSESFRREIAATFPTSEFPSVALVEIPMSHPIFRTVYDVTRLDSKRHNHTPKLEGLTIEGRLVVVFSSDGLNDTAAAGGNCCCCGGDEIVNSRQVNVNILAYALTH